MPGDERRPALFSSLEEAAAAAGGVGRREENDGDVNALLGALRDKHRARRDHGAVEASPPTGQRRNREETALRRNQELGQRVRLGGDGSAALSAIAGNTERLQTQAAQLSLHESTKALLEKERAEWRAQLSSLENTLKVKDAAIGALQRRCDLLERTCADQVEVRDREHQALVTRVAQLETSIEIWAQEMSTGVKAERTRSAVLSRSGSMSSVTSLPASPATVQRKQLSLEALKGVAAEDGAVFALTQDSMSFISEADPASPASPHHRVACGGGVAEEMRLGTGSSATMRPDESLRSDIDAS
jgi:predicted RNase H-like nuclease (RuvC/YqgF family)